MKSILYVGATLMIGASVYGFVDYKKTSHRKEFTSMYEEKKVTEPVTVAVNRKTEPVTKKESLSYPVVSKEKKATIKKEAVNTDEVIASIKPIAEDEKVVVSKTKEIEKTSVNVPVSENSGIEKKKRKFSTKLFSRGALDERYIEPKEKVKASKDEAKKAENKEQ